MEHTISVNLKIWRQRGPKEKGQFVNYHLDNVSTGSSFLEMLDMLNQQLVEQGEEPVVFDSDCREGICGMCSLYINGHPHGPVQGITTCQLHMRKFNDGDTITVGEDRLKVIHTPGHSPGGICLYSPTGKLLIAGDTLFKGSIGRTDLEGGNHHQLVESVRKRLLTLPGDTLVLSGHGPATTIADEKASNPFL